MSSAEKMIHVQSLLRGEGKALVDAYDCNGDLYAAALSRLQEHFGNSKSIVNAFHEKLSLTQLNAMCKNYDQTSHIIFPEFERDNVSITIGICNLIHNKQIIKASKMPLGRWDSIWLDVHR